MQITAIFILFILFRRVLVRLILGRKKRHHSNHIDYIYKDYLTTDLKVSNLLTRWPSFNEQLILLPDQISLLKRLPFNAASKLWGVIHSIDLPIFLRHLILGFYSFVFDCHLEEALIQDLAGYSNLNQFFRRPLKPGIRAIESGSIVVSNRILNTHLFIYA